MIELMIRRREMAKKSLPYDRLLDVIITSNGMFRTDFYPTRNTKVVIDAMVTELPTSSMNRQLVFSYNGSPKRRFDIQIIRNSTNISFSSGTNDTAVTLSYSLNTRYTFEAYNTPSRTLKIGDSTKTNGSVLSYTCVNPLGIFRSTPNGNVDCNFVGKCWLIEIYESDVLVRRYVPAIKNNVIGMYESVNNVMKFPDTGTFTTE